MRHIPGLAQLAKHPDGERLIKELRRLGHGKNEECYSFHVSDAFALLAALSLGSIEEIVGYAKKLVQTASGRFSASDLFYFMMRRKSFSFDRERLKEEITDGFKEDIHRADSNFDSYNSYNFVSRDGRPAEIGLVDLNRISELRKWLAGPDVRKSFGAIIREDIDKYEASELGGAIKISGDGLENVVGEPVPTFNNGSHNASQSIRDIQSVSIATYHLHATAVEDGAYAGPSGNQFVVGGDISVAKMGRANSLVITSIDGNHFCAHYYSPEGDVVFLGRYEY
jgi:hypothetical protein